MRTQYHEQACATWHQTRHQPLHHRQAAASAAPLCGSREPAARNCQSVKRLAVPGPSVCPGQLSTGARVMFSASVYVWVHAVRLHSTDALIPAKAVGESHGLATRNHLLPPFCADSAEAPTQDPHPCHEMRCCQSRPPGRHARLPLMHICTCAAPGINSTSIPLKSNPVAAL